MHTHSHQCKTNKMVKILAKDPFKNAIYDHRSGRNKKNINMKENIHAQHKTLILSLIMGLLFDYYNCE